MYFPKQPGALLEQFHVFSLQMNCCQFVDPNQNDTFVLKLVWFDQILVKLSNMFEKTRSEALQATEQ